MIEFKCPNCDSTFEDKTLDRIKAQLEEIHKHLTLILDNMKNEE